MRLASGQSSNIMQGDQKCFPFSKMALRRFLDIIGCARLNKTGRGKLNTEGGGGFNPRIKPAEPAGASAPEGRLSNFHFETGIVPQPLQPIVNRALPLVYEMLAAPMDARTRKRHSDWSGVSSFCAGHWPPRHFAAGGLSTVPSQTFPTGSSLLRAAALAVALAGRLLFLGWPDYFQQPYHHWRLSWCN
jgi:hypothetical protein